jgi:DNA-directed RNA polymerase specialized sigma24 family protein
VNLLSGETKAGAGSFHSTRWAVVLAAAGDGATPSQSYEALSELCRIYWQPVYVFLRRNGHSPADSQDLTQGFFAKLIETHSYARAEREKGRFRSFLLGALKHFVADERAYDQAQKRGGGRILEPFDEAATAEAEAQVLRVGGSDLLQLYDRAWAEALLRHALHRLGEECAFAGKATLFDALRSHLSPGSEETVPYNQLALRLGRAAVTLRKDVERLRRRFGEILREEVRGTVTDPAEVDNELRYLCRTVAAM